MGYFKLSPSKSLNNYTKPLSFSTKFVIFLKVNVFKYFISTLIVFLK